MNQQHIGFFVPWQPEASVPVGRQVAVDAFFDAVDTHGRASYLGLVAAEEEALIRKRLVGERLTILPLGPEVEKRLGSVDVWHDAAFDVSRVFALRKLCGRATPITLGHHTLSYRSQLVETYLPLLLQRPTEYDSIICTSTAARRALEELLGYVAEEVGRVTGAELPYRGRLDVIPLGVDVHRFKPRPAQKDVVRQQLDLPKGAFVLLWLGRLSAIDKADLMPLLTVFRDLVKRNPKLELRLLCVGNMHPGEQFGKALSHFAGSLGLGDRVRIIEMPRKDVHFAYNAADVFVSPVDNVQESFGLTPLEAMASGVPQVVSDWNGYRDTVLHDVTGLLVPTLWADCDADLVRLAPLRDVTHDHLALAQSVVVDPDALRDAIQSLIDRPEVRARMADASVERARSTFTWGAVVAQHEALWAELGEQATASSTPFDSTLSAVPYTRVFGHYPSRLLEPGTRFELSEEASVAIASGALRIPSYHKRFQQHRDELFQALLLTLSNGQPRSLDALVLEVAQHLGSSKEDRRSILVRHLMFLMKNHLVRAR